jgi:hypothetical protein
MQKALEPMFISIAILVPHDPAASVAVLNAIFPILCLVVVLYALRR